MNAALTGMNVSLGTPDCSCPRIGIVIFHEGVHFASSNQSLSGERGSYRRCLAYSSFRESTAFHDSALNSPGKTTNDHFLHFQRASATLNTIFQITIALCWNLRKGSKTTLSPPKFPYREVENEKMTSS